MRGLRHIVRFAIGGVLLCTGCNVTRHIPDGEYLVRKVRIEDDKSVPRKERIPASELEKYIRQTPNKRFLGTDFYVWIYEQADPDKTNWWNDWKRKIGQAPVLLDMRLTERSAQNLKVYMDSRGYFRSRSSFDVDTLSRRKRATVTYRIRQSEPYRIDTLAYDFKDRFLEQLVLPDTVNSLVRPGDVYNIAVLDEERERIAARLKQRGYYNFSVNNIRYLADTLGGGRRVALTMIVEQHVTGYDARGQALKDNNMVYRIDRINLFPDYDPAVARTDSTFARRLDTTYYRGLNIIYRNRLHLRRKVLRRSVPLYPNYIYDSEQVNRTYSDLMGLGYFRSAKIAFVEQPQRVDVTDVVSYVGEDADTTRTFYTREGYLECNILCTPALKQSVKVELEGSTTSSFYGLKATVGYQNRNVFRGAEALDLAVTAGYEFMKAPDARKKTAKEFGVSAGLSFPRFWLPWSTYRYRVNQPRTKVELSINVQNRPFYRRVLSSAGLTYLWSNRSYSSFSLRPVDINVIDVSDLNEDFLGQTNNKYLVESFRTQFIGGLSFGYVYNNHRKHLGGNATNIRFNFETAGNLIDAVEHLFYKRPAGSDYYTIFGIQYSQYFRTDLSASRKIMLGEKTAIVGRLYGGVAKAYGNSTVIPFDRQFYCGGSNGMRGWTPRTLGPGSVPNPHDPYPIQTGDLKLEANLELRFPIWGMIHGATFFDLGNIWWLESGQDRPAESVFHIDEFYRQLGFNTGLGIRLDIKFAVLRLDWGIQLHNPNNPAGERWIHNFRWKNTALNFGVGYPF